MSDGDYTIRIERPIIPKELTVIEVMYTCVVCDEDGERRIRMADYYTTDGKYLAGKQLEASEGLM